MSEIAFRSGTTVGLAGPAPHDGDLAPVVDEAHRLMPEVDTTKDARVLRNPLSLRTTKDDAAFNAFNAFTQPDIDVVAEQTEDALCTATPITHTAFEDGGRIAP